MPLHPQAQKVQKALKEAGCSAQVRELPDSTRTAGEAAQAVGCQVAQIVKSLVFSLQPAGTPVLVLVSGANRVNEKAFGEQVGGVLGKADPNLVQQVTGFAIGGVPPIGHTTRLQTYLDQDLLQYPVVWAAAGTPHAVFPVAPDELLRITGARLISVL